ncbi:MAG: hypothetical protein NTW83_13985 [Cyanobacteria bacterium]|nr:hypothetical protein [Cyanobacteriota bacterium]
MTFLPAMLAFALVLALPLTLLVSGLVLLLYRRTLLRWMARRPAPAATAHVPAFLAQEWRMALPPPATSPITDGSLPRRPELIRRERRFWGFLAMLWLLIGLSGALLYLVVVGIPLSPLRILGVGLAWASPGWMALGLMARLPWRRGLTLTLGCVLVPGLILWLSMVDQGAGTTLQLLAWLLPLQGVPFVALSLLVGLPALRATAPLLYPPVLAVTLLALAGQAALMQLHNLGFSTRLMQLLPPMIARPSVLILVAHLLPVLGGLWLAHGLSRCLAHSYRQRHFSDLSYSLGAAALVVLLFAVIPSWSSSGADGRALAPLLAWLWLPIGFTLLAPQLLMSPPRQATTLLVLRLFRRPGPVGWLFDQVVQRWRFLGPVLLISGADLAMRTLDADELTGFIDGRLGERFVDTAADLQRQIGAEATSTDHDGRYRVHDICCTDSSWQGTLEALLQRSQLVLMDLRGFQAANLGCLHELGRLAATPALRRVVLLVDGSTDRVTAATAFDGGSPVCWVEERRLRHPTMEALLTALCPG